MYDILLKNGLIVDGTGAPGFVGDVAVEKGKLAALEWTLELPESVKAPVEAGQVLGKVTVRAGEEELAVLPLRAESAVEKQGFGYIFQRLTRMLFGGEI